MRPAPLVIAIVAVVVAGAAVWWLARSDDHASPRAQTPVQAEDRREGEAAPTQEPVTAIKPRAFDPAQDSAAAESAATLDPNALVVAGKVVDDRRKPVYQATVELVLEKRASVSARTGADGRFRIAAGARPKDGRLRGAVHASDARGRAQLAALPAEPAADGVLDVGVLALAESGPIAIRVVKDGQGVAGARVYFGTRRELGFGPFATDAQGMLGPRRMPEGTRVVTAFSGDLAFRGEARATVPGREGGPLDVILAPAWKLAVVVKDGVNGQPAAGVAVELQSSIKTGDMGIFQFAATIPDPIAPTDADGRTVVAGLSMERAVTAYVASPSASPMSRMFMRDDQARKAAEPGAEEVVLTVGAVGETFRFPIVADETDGPPDGAEVSLSVPSGYGSAPPPPKGKVVGRDLVIDHLTDRHINILATAADGSSAIVRILGDSRKTKIGSEAKFRLPRALVLTAHDRKGSPLAGYLAECRSPGNVPIGKAVAIGPDGSARLEGLAPERVDVSIRGAADNVWEARTVGVVDLTKPGEGRLDVVLERERRCQMRVTVDGEKRLPATISVGMAVERGIRMSGGVGPLAEDPDEAVVRFDVRPEAKQKSLKLSVSGRGCAPVTVPVDLPADDEATIELAAALVTGAKIRVHVLPPADNLHDVGLEVYDDKNAIWTPRGYGFGPDGEELGKKPTEIAIDALPAGRYRARDALTGLVSDPADVATGAAADVTIDLSRAGVVTGRVEGPADVREHASVVIEGDGLARRNMGPMGDRGVQVRLNSEFSARVPGDRVVTLKVTHPFLLPPPEGGSVVVKDPGASVVLKLVAGAETKFRLSGSVDRDGPDVGAFDAMRVLLFNGKAEGEPVQTCKLRLQGGNGTFAGYKPGKYTLWFDLRPATPLVLEDVELGAEGTDLGELESPEGATVRVKIQVKEGQEFPRIRASARPIGKPDYVRNAFSAKAAEVLIRGLGAGRFKVTVHAGDFRAAPHEREIESTGSGEIGVDVDLR